MHTCRIRSNKRIKGTHLYRVLIEIEIRFMCDVLDVLVLHSLTHPLLLVQFMHVPISQRFVLHFIDIFLDILDPKQTKQRKHHQPANTKKKKKKKEKISVHPVTTSSSFVSPLKQYNNNVSPKQRTSHKTLRASPSAFSNAPPCNGPFPKCSNHNRWPGPTLY